ncbi:hypothetical protein CVV43_04925 [Candidatus Saccharibacteria bacterium HGW-Saccharibacteria-1]|nr:MAG: hypothetical protein CVV43_04925 [Candidatus Saccharibacteria bacterium HGW-Saccharibacteria-1]
MIDTQNLILRAENVSKKYHSGGVDVKALDDITIDIKAGEFIMITGRNGSGKFVEGNKTTHLPEKLKMELRLSQLGYIFQEYALIAELTAIENVMLPAMMLESSKVAKSKALKMLSKMNLQNKVKRLPSQLSGGEQQKVAIARALINEPTIIFADEPTANLDSIASKEVLEIFKSLNEHDNITIIMITHEPEELVYASRIIQLSDGKLV